MVNRDLASAEEGLVGVGDRPAPGPTARGGTGSGPRLGERAVVLIDTDHATYLKYPESDRGRRLIEVPAHVVQFPEGEPAAAPWQEEPHYFPDGTGYGLGVWHPASASAER